MTDVSENMSEQVGTDGTIVYGRARFKRPRRLNGFVFGFLFRFLVFTVTALCAFALVLVAGLLFGLESGGWIPVCLTLIMSLPVLFAEHVRTRIFERTRRGIGTRVEIELSSQGLKIDGEILGRDETSADGRRSSYARFWKRIFDVTVALIALLMVAPLICVTAVMIKLDDGGPALFRQRRLGRGGQLFDCYKFRTMIIDADARLEAELRSDPAARDKWLVTQKMRDDPRVTHVGRILRRTSLDELPTLFNVLKGDMSLVGPRPLSQVEAGNFGPDIGKIQSMRPGITGLWQVSGGGDSSYLERLEKDLYYARHVSFMLDLRILMKAIKTTLINAAY